MFEFRRSVGARCRRALNAAALISRAVRSARHICHASLEEEVVVSQPHVRDCFTWIDVDGRRTPRRICPS